MKKATVLFVAALFGVGIWLGAAQAADKLGYVDLSRIFSEYGKTKDYDKVLSDKEQLYTSERDKKVADIKKFQEQMNVLSEKENE